MLWEPHLEGRNDQSFLFQIYFNDPFLAYVYIASISFFAVLYQAFSLLGYIGKNEAFFPHTVKSFQTIKYCSLALIGFIIGAEAYFFIIQRGQEDIAGGVAIGIFMIVISIIVATASAVFERTLQIDAQVHKGT